MMCIISLDLIITFFIFLLQSINTTEEGEQLPGPWHTTLDYITGQVQKN